jgi:hypothetical protein
LDFLDDILGGSFYAGAEKELPGNAFVRLRRLPVKNVMTDHLVIHIDLCVGKDTDASGVAVYLSCKFQAYGISTALASGTEFKTTPEAIGAIIKNRLPQSVT